MRKFPALLAAIALCVLLACPSITAATMSQAAVDDAMARGDAADKAGDYVGAETIYNSIVSNAPTNPKAPEAMAHVGALQYKTNRRSASMETYKALVQRYPDTMEAAMVLYRMGAVYMHDKDFQASQDAFRAAAENKSISELNRGRALLQVGFVDMMRYFGTTDLDGPIGGLSSLPNLGQGGDRDMYLRSAEQQFRSTRDLFINSANPGIAAVADAAIGEIHLLHGEPVLAEEAYRSALAENGSAQDKVTCLLHHGLGQSLYGQDKLEEALAQFDLALTTYSPGGQYGFGVASIQQKADLHAWKVLSLYGLKRFDEALVAVHDGKEAIGKEPAIADQAPSMDLWEGLILCQTDKTDEGLSILREVVAGHAGTRYATQAGSLISQFEEGTTD